MEAHPAAIGAQLLAGSGTLLGPSILFEPGEAGNVIRHHPKIFVAVVGSSSSGAKGVADAAALAVLHRAEPTFLRNHSITGLGSGEALIDALRDDADPPTEKRRIVHDAELSMVLRVARRDGSILSDVLRKCFDDQPLANRTKKDGEVTASHHHVSIVGSITPAELVALLDDLSIANGLANRFLYVHSHLVRKMPFGGVLPPEIVERTASFIRDAVERPPRSMTFAKDARARWQDFYMDWRTGMGPGVMEVLTSRQVAHASRIATIYAALAGDTAVHLAHLEAAIGWCDYSAATIERVFVGTVAGKAGQLLQAIRDAGENGLTGTAMHNVFQRHASAEELTELRRALEERGLITTSERPTSGRPRLLSCPIWPKEST